jgi:hypothetical protein
VKARIVVFIGSHGGITFAMHYRTSRIFENNNAAQPGYRPSIALPDTLPVTPSTHMLPARSMFVQPNNTRLNNQFPNSKNAHMI